MINVLLLILAPFFTAFFAARLINWWTNSIILAKQEAYIRCLKEDNND